MNSHLPEDRPATSPKTPDLGRRRFARGGAVAPVVLGTLASQPVLGQSLYHCTVSGQVSGNLSRAGAITACRVGDGPVYWATQVSWPSPFVKGTLPNPSNCNFTGGGRERGTNFNGFGAGGSLLNSAFFNNNPTGQQTCTVLVTGSAGVTSDPSTMLQVLSTTSPSEQFKLGRLVVASLLNAQRSAGYPVSQNTIIWMFNATFSGGTYSPGYGAPAWSRATVIAYLESLLGSA